MQTTIQSEFRYTLGDPNGREYAPVGILYVDYETGDVYKKTTAQEFNFGWVNLGPSGAQAGFAKSYDTFDDLRAEQVLIDHGFYWLRGGFELHDANGGAFTFNATSLLPDDGFSILMPLSRDILHPGRFERDI